MNLFFRLVYYTLIHPFEWQYILIPLLPAKLKDLLDAPVPYITGIVGKNFDKFKILDNYESALVVFLDSGELFQSEGLVLKKSPSLGNLESKIEAPYKKLFKSNSKREPRYCPTSAEIEAASKICKMIDEAIKQNILSKLPAKETKPMNEVDLEDIKTKLKGATIEADREFIEKLVETQLFATYIGEYYNVDCNLITNH